MIGNFNPCMRMELENEKGEAIGGCLDTPNSFACACLMSQEVFRGVVHDRMFGDTIRYASNCDTQKRILMLSKDKEWTNKLKENIYLK